MSISIYWKPCNEKRNNFQHGTSAEWDVFEQTFGSEVGPDDIRTLCAMSAAANTSFYAEVADIVDQVGSIKLWASY